MRIRLNSNEIITMVHKVLEENGVQLGDHDIRIVDAESNRHPVGVCEVEIVCE